MNNLRTAISLKRLHDIEMMLLKAHRYCEYADIQDELLAEVVKIQRDIRKTEERHYAMKRKEAKK